MTQNELYLSKVNQANECVLKIRNEFLIEFMEKQLYALEVQIRQDFEKLTIQKIKTLISNIEFIIEDSSIEDNGIGIERKHLYQIKILKECF